MKRKRSLILPCLGIVCGVGEKRMTTEESMDMTEEDVCELTLESGPLPAVAS